MSQRRSLVLTAVGIGLAVAAWLLTLPQTDAGQSAEDASRLSGRGDILSLEKISQKAKAIKPGQVLEVELEKKHGRYVYEVEILDARSQVWELKLDAKSGQLLEMEQDD